VIRYLLLFVLTTPVTAFANSIEIYKFENAEQEKIYHSLTQDLRCLVCQNQNIAETNAELAKDMRRKAYEMVMQGKTESEISEFMSSRYGDFVLYRPPFKPMTWLLWLGPIIIFIFGIIFVVRFMRSQPDDVVAEKLSNEDLERIKNLHAEQEDK